MYIINTQSKLPVVINNDSQPLFSVTSRHSSKCFTYIISHSNFMVQVCYYCHFTERKKNQGNEKLSNLLRVPSQVRHRFKTSQNAPEPLICSSRRPPARTKQAPRQTTQFSGCLCHLLVWWSWAIYLTLICLSFPTWKMITIVFSQALLWRANAMKSLIQRWQQSKRLYMTIILFLPKVWTWDMLLS